MMVPNRQIIMKVRKKLMHMMQSMLKDLQAACLQCCAGQAGGMRVPGE